MLSLRHYAQCIGLTPPFSVLRDFFGYETPKPWTNAGSASVPLSLRAQMTRLNSRFCNLAVVKYGASPDGLGADGFWVDPVRSEQVDCAIQLAREIYANLGLGIGRVTRWWLPDARGIVRSETAVRNLIEYNNAPTDGIEVFFIEDYVGTTGTPVGVTPSGEDGFIVDMQNSFFGTGRTLAHELGHFFGLDHRNTDPTNLMCQSRFAPAASSLPTLLSTTGLDEWQRPQAIFNRWTKSPCSEEPEVGYVEPPPILGPHEVEAPRDPPPEHG